MKTRGTEYDYAVLRYCIGALIAMALSVAAFLAVVLMVSEQTAVLAGILLVLAAIQAGVQLHFFLHVGKGNKPRWQMHSFWFAAVMTAIIVVGSLWIMKNLDYNMGMSPDEMHQHMIKENKKGF